MAEAGPPATTLATPLAPEPGFSPMLNIILVLNTIDFCAQHVKDQTNDAYKFQYIGSYCAFYKKDSGGGGGGGETKLTGTFSAQWQDKPKVIQCSFHILTKFEYVFDPSVEIFTLVSYQCDSGFPIAYPIRDPIIHIPIGGKR